MSEKKTFYVTTPIYYPSNKLHIGHTYTTVAGDVIARYKRLRGYDVMYLTGTDEHGLKIQKTAKEAGKTPQAFVDEIVSGIKKLWKSLDISYDFYIRTTDERHKQVVQRAFQKLLDQGDIYLGEYEGLYCIPCEAYFTERQAPDLKCLDCGRPLEKVKEKSYFFRMSKYVDRLVQYYDDHPEFIEPESRKNEMLQNFIKPGLEDLSISRTTFDWGVKVLHDPEHVVYVWLDALLNYVSAIGYLSNDPTEQLDFEKYWPADVHLVGKDIVRFHTIYWPIILMALDLPLPKKVFAHGYFLVRGEKMSKSLGNVIDPEPFVQHFGLDAVRYYLLREVPFGADGVFTPENFIDRVNADLANDLGNLLHRSLTMIEKYFDGIIPRYIENGTEFDAELTGTITEVIDKFEQSIEKLQYSVALTELWKIVRAGNRYIEKTTPWNLAKEEKNKEILGSVLYHLLETIRIVSIMIQPFLTRTSQKIWDQINIVEGYETEWDSINRFGGLKSGKKINKGEPIFPRLDVATELEVIDEIMKQSAQRREEPKKEKKTDQKEETTDDLEITIDDFMKVELKVAEVIKAEPVKGANRLLKLQLDLGTEQRQVVSGIAEYYHPEELKGVKVICVTNLKPIKLRGEDSNGMILAAKSGDRLTLSTVSSEIPNGTRVK